MRSLRLAAATVACLSAVALLSACDPEGTDTGDSAASGAPTAVPSAPAAAKTPAAKTPAASEAAATPGKAGRLPAGVWVDPKAVPLNAALHWSAPGPAKVLGEQGKLQIETLCHTRRDEYHAEVAMVETASLGGASGDWKADETIASYGSGADSSGVIQTTYALMGVFAQGVKDCAETAPGAEVTVIGEDADHLFADVTLPQADGSTVVVHEFLVSNRGSIAELTLRADLPAGARPKTAWTAPTDRQALSDALGKPACTAFKDCV
ncbi:hypothetical protein [Kitasatospora phosalacinea]|uniref:Lipoprotein n=1 Tax=Kitasatospora phosalacinea TaxID=2065 RepID=A0A9W6PIW0_9ACTN|nr:hypothetical protein [Kitasatospora phosalacinea]GLW55666.1 hypothetical protein Kpho01_36770 [Kitasatospora phosalacinea]